MVKARDNAFKPIWGLLAILVGFAAIGVISRFTAAKDKVPWRTDLTAATAESKRDNKPLLLYFTATWCGPCQEMKHETWSREEVAGKLQAYVPVKIDIDENVALAERYRVESVPTLLLLDGDGNVVKSSFYRLTANELLEWIGSS